MTLDTSVFSEYFERGLTCKVPNELLEIELIMDYETSAHSVYYYLNIICKELSHPKQPNWVELQLSVVEKKRSD